MEREVSLGSRIMLGSDSEVFFKTLLENAFDGIGIIGFDGSVKYHSSPIKNILGYTDAFENIANIFNLIHPDDADAFRFTLRELKKASATSHGALTARFKHLDGSWRYLATRLNNLNHDPAIRGVIISYRDITSKQLLRKSIEESEERYRSLIENSFDGITIVNYDGIVNYHSPSLLRILGYRPESGVGKSILELLHPDDHKIFHQAQEHWGKHRNKTFQSTVRFKHKNESWVILEIRAMDLNDKPGIEGFLINYRDITESKQLETALLQSESRYKSLAAASPVGIFTTDPHGNCTFVNEQWCEMSGLSYHESMGKGWSKNIHPDDIPAVWQNWAEAAEKKQPSRKEYRLCKRDGKITWVYCQAVPEFDAAGNVTGYIGSVTDISERVQMEKALQEGSELYRAMVENAPEAIFIVDAEKCKFVDFNENAEKLFGYSREQILQMQAMDVCPPLQPDGKKSSELAAEKMKEALAGGKPVYELQYKDAKGRLFMVEERLVRFPPYDRKLVLGTAVDITERNRIKSELHDTEERYRNLVEFAPETIFLVDAETGNILDANSNATNLFGYSREQLLKMKGIDLSPDNQPDGVSSLEFINEKINEALSGKSPVYEWMHKDAKGRLLPCEVRIVQFPPYDKKIIRGTVIDISARKAIENKLHESEERYRDMVENAQETIFVIDAATDKIVDFNENAVRLFGYKRDVLLNMNVSDLFSPDQPDRSDPVENSKEKAREALSKGKAFMELTFRKSNGNAFPGEVHLSHFPPFDRKLLRGTVIDISAKKEIEKKLREQELHYKHLATVSPVGIFRTDAKGKTVYVNEKWCAVAGIPVTQAKGDGWIKAVHPNDRARVGRDWKDALKQKKISRLEFRFLTPKGKTHWVIGEAVPDFDEQGNFLGFAGSITDITERVKTEQALAKSEQRNSVLLNAIPDMIFRLSKSGIFLDCKIASTFNPIVPPEAFLGKNVKDILPRPVAELCMKNIRKALRTNEIQTYSYSLPDLFHKSKLNFFEARIVAYDSNEALALIRDITQQQEAELSLRASEERWKSLVKSAPQHIVTINGKDEISFINNPRNVPVELLKGVNVFDLTKFFGIDEKPVRRALRQARRGIHETLEITVKDEKKNDIWFSVISAPVISNGGVEDLIVMALDITETKKADKELRQTNEKLKALYQRLETIREEEKKNIAMEIHDELGQELTALKLGMFWLQHYFERREDGYDVKQVRQKIKSLIELSTQTIGSARRLAHQLRPVVLDNLGLMPAIEWLVEQTNESGAARCSFQTNLGNEKFAQEFSVALFRIVQESLTNILRHAKASEASVRMMREDTKLKLTIEDNGLGIKAADMKQPEKIGIFGMKERIRTWDGSFDISGIPGKGTRLKITFPLKAITKAR